MHLHTRPMVRPATDVTPVDGKTGTPQFSAYTLGQRLSLLNHPWSANG